MKKKLFFLFERSAGADLHCKYSSIQVFKWVIRSLTDDFCYFILNLNPVQEPRFFFVRISVLLPRSRYPPWFGNWLDWRVETSGQIGYSLYCNTKITAFFIYIVVALGPGKLVWVIELRLWLGRWPYKMQCAQALTFTYDLEYTSANNIP